MGNPADATRFDPYGEMGHVKATTPADAVKAYADAVVFASQVGRITDHRGGRVAWQEEHNRRAKLVTEAAHCVLLTGLAQSELYKQSTEELGGAPTHFYAPMVDPDGSDTIGYVCRSLGNLKQHELEYIQAIEDLRNQSENRCIPGDSPELEAITQTFIEKDAE